MKTIYQFLPQLIIRTPAFAFNDDFDEAFLLQLLENPHFSEALYLASPVLFEEAKALKNQEKVEVKKKQKSYFLYQNTTLVCVRGVPHLVS
jgi:hypothetical protein